MWTLVYPLDTPDMVRHPGPPKVPLKYILLTFPHEITKHFGKFWILMGRYIGFSMDF